ncbi:MAG: VWA domain-containing protein [Kiritimatiellia bacterium]|nr:VWA domain-containing protein [Kiritimatiellia bacterium]
MFRFADPYYFFLLIPLTLAFWTVYAQRVNQATVFAPTHRLPPARQSWRKSLRFFLPALYLIGLILAIIALARPQTMLSKTAVKANAIAIQMVVDVSGSMQALDFSTATKSITRLDVVKETFAKFIKRRPDDLIGLVTFGGFATCRVPLTVDHGVLLHCLKGVETPRPRLDSQGDVANQEEFLTAIGDALATACARLEKTEIKSKVIVLLSDGESNTGIIKPDDAIKAAKALAIKVYTIGVGSNGRAPFLMQDVFGRKIVKYAEVRIDEELLRRIAETTKGQYFNVRDPKGLTKALSEIDKLEKTAVKKEIYNQYNEWYLHFLAPGLVLLIMAASLNMLSFKEIV